MTHVPEPGPDSRSSMPEESRRGKPWASCLSGVVCLAVVAPIVENFRAEPRDDFPLSYYPMFSSKRPDDYAQQYMLGVDADGRAHPLPHRFGGDGGMNQTRRQLKRTINEADPEHLDDFCRVVADRVSRSHRAPYNRIVEVQLVVGTYRISEYFTGGSREPLDLVVHASCPVERLER